MNAEKLLNTQAVTMGVGIIVGGALLYWVASKIIDKLGDAAGAVGDAVNPTSDKNLAYRGVNAVGAAVSGDSSWSLGSWLYDVFNPPYDPNAPYQPRKLTVRDEAKVYDWLTDHG